MSRALVVLETAGNQAFIFGSTKRRENAGASQLLWRAGTEFPLTAVRAAGGPDPFDADPARLRDNLLNRPRHGGIEVVLAVSGKAVLIVDDEPTARRIVRAATLEALRQAPGVDLRGAVVPLIDPTPAGFRAAIRAAHAKLELVRAAVPGPAVRFLRLPVADECGATGLPAARISSQLADGEQDKARSAVSEAKLTAIDGWTSRMGQLAGRVAPGRRFALNAKDLDQLDQNDWLAVVHADGNGLGRVFSHFHEYVEPAAADDLGRFTDALRRFSLALDDCGERAFGRALAVVAPGSEPLPVVPLVLGGDDLTAVCDGRWAIPFAVEYLRQFEQLTEADDAIRPIIRRGPEPKHARGFATASAGVAVVKPHFPFHMAYELAEDLTVSAKRIVRDLKLADDQPPCSAIDWHVVYDASPPDLKQLRELQQIVENDGQTLLYARPYAVTPTSSWPERPVQLDKRDIDRLKQRVSAVRRSDPGDASRRALPNTMLHELRAGLFLGRTEADGRLDCVRGRYQFGGLLDDPKTLFWTESLDVRRTALLDAMDLNELLPSAEDGGAAWLEPR